MMYDAMALLCMNDLLRYIFMKYLKSGSTAEDIYTFRSWGIRYKCHVQKTKNYIKKSCQIYH